MKKIIVLILFVFTGEIATAQRGVEFYKGYTWTELKQIARKQRKYIFIDAYTTWCGPCKVMDKEVFTDLGLGSYFNQNFVSVKIQIDSTANDNDEIKQWYPSAADIEKQFQIKAYPTLLFLTPEGELVKKFEGLKTAQQLTEAAKEIRDPAKQYPAMIKEYNSGKRMPSFVRNLARTMNELGDTARANEIARDYLAKLTEAQLHEEDNVQFAGDFLRNSQDRGFKLFLNHWAEVGRYISNKDFGPGVTSLIIYNEEIKPYLDIKNGKPDFVKIKENLRKYGQYGEKTWNQRKGEIYYTYELTPFLMTYPDWISVKHLLQTDNSNLGELNLIRYILQFYANANIFESARNVLAELMTYYQDKYPNEVSIAELNQAAFALGSVHSTKQQFRNALQWITTALESNDNVGYKDTKSCILYGMGRTAEAVKLQEEIVEMVKESSGPVIDELRTHLDMMKKGKPISSGYSTSDRLISGDAVNFTGESLLDSINSQLAGMKANLAAPLVQTITHTKDSVVIKRLFNSTSKPIIERYPINGKVLRVEIGNTLVRKWLILSKDRANISVYSIYSTTPEKGDPFEYSRLETWGLTKDKKSVLLARRTMLPDRVDNVQALYHIR